MKVGVTRVGLLALIATVAPLLCAGSTSRILALSPENVEAQAIGPLSAYLEGRGPEGGIWLKMPNGQVLKGQFKINVGGSVGALGRKYGIDRPGGAYTTSGYSMKHASPAVIDMQASGGVVVHCEVMNDDTHAQGSGVCAFSNGAVYRVLY